MIHVFSLLLLLLLFFHSSLPSFDKDTKEKVDKDIESARKWIKEYLWHLQSRETFYCYMIKLTS